MRQLLIWGPILGLGMLIGYVLTIRFGQHTATPKRIDTVTRETIVPREGGQGNELRGRVTSVESELAAMRARLAGLEAAPAPNPSAAAESPPPIVDARELARQKEEWHAHMTDVEAEYQIEGRDPAWAREAQATIQRVLDGLPALSRGMRSLECRSETCRLEVVNDRQPDFDKQLPLLHHGMSALPSAEYDQVSEPDGKIRTIVYFSRHADDPAAG
jgi:hypothetical protein